MLLVLLPLSLLLGLLAPSPGVCQQPAASVYSERKQQHHLHHKKTPAEDHATWLLLQENVTTGNEADQARLREMRMRQRRQRREAKKKAERAAEEEAMESTKVELMRDFAREHGEKIRKSRRHADLFDGSGYLMDVMEELKEYEDKADEHRRRKRRSVGDPDDEQLPEFRSLGHLLAHLNEGEQSEIHANGLRLRFFNEELDVSIVEEEEEEVSEGETAKDEASPAGSPNSQAGTDSNEAKRQQQQSTNRGPKPPHRRRKRSTRSLDRDEDREREAQTSIWRLDANLAELGRQLDQEYRDDRMEEEEEEHRRDADARRERPFVGYSRHLTAAYKTLMELRQGVDTAVPSSANKGDTTSDENSWQQRMGDLPLFPDKEAEWDLHTEALRENMQQLRQMYRQADEL